MWIFCCSLGLFNFVDLSASNIDEGGLGGCEGNMRLIFRGVVGS